MLRRPVESALGPVIGMDNAAGRRTAVLRRHVEGVHDEVGVVDGVDRPADDPAAEWIQNAAAVDLPFERRVLRMSVTQSPFGGRRGNFRFTRSSAVAMPRSRFTGAGPGSP